MKALRIAFFACVLSVFFCFTAYADNSVTLAIPYLSSTTVTEQFTTTVSTNGEFFGAGEFGYLDVTNNWSKFSVMNYNGVNVGGANVEYQADFTVESVSAGAGCTVTRSGNRFYIKSEYTDFGTNGVPITVVYSVSAKWTRGVVPTTSNPLDNCYLRGSCSVSVSNLTKTDNNMPNEWDNTHTINSINSKVDDILNALDDMNRTGPMDFLGPDAVLYFDNRYFHKGSYNITVNDNGYFTLNNISSEFYILNYPDSPGIFLDTGQYYVVLLSNGGQLETFSFQADKSYFNVSFVNSYSKNNSHLYVYLLTVKTPFTAFEMSFKPRDGVTLNGVFYGGIVPRSSSDTLSSALNPDQDNKNSELNSEANKQSQQEDQLWQNVNTYKSQLDFSLSGWNEATSGLSYVSSIFMAIWNNSPRQIITLSLMLGIGMLAIGRGVKAAVRQKDGDP